MDYPTNPGKNSLLCFKFLRGIKHLPLTKIHLDVLNIRIVNQIKMFLCINNNLNQFQEQKLKVSIKFITKFICMQVTKKSKEKKTKNSISN
jgi:hypothetical protein